MASKRRAQRAKSEMNVVPYIDVMLVLLVIFMITAPLLNQAVDVTLPHSENAQEIESSDAVDALTPLVVSIDRQGAFYIDRADDNTLPVTTQLIVQITSETLANDAKTPVYIRADKEVDYGAVMIIMDVLKSSGAKAVGLITESEAQ